MGGVKRSNGPCTVRKGQSVVAGLMSEAGIYAQEALGGGGEAPLEADGKGATQWSEISVGDVLWSVGKLVGDLYEVLVMRQLCGCSSEGQMLVPCVN